MDKSHSSGDQDDSIIIERDPSDVESEEDLHYFIQDTNQDDGKTVASQQTTTVYCRNKSVQTENIESLFNQDEQQDQVDECYPEYAVFSRLDFAKQLEEKMSV